MGEDEREAEAGVVGRDLCEATAAEDARGREGGAAGEVEGHGLVGGRERLEGDESDYGEAKGEGPGPRAALPFASRRSSLAASVVVAAITLPPPL